jgi:polyhydroxybutyrate depolymerase
LIGTLLFVGVTLVVVLWLLWRRRTLVRWHTINVNGSERRYLVCSSDEGARHKPLLLCFHGGRAQVELLARRSGIAEAGQLQGYMVIFPEAKDGWIDLRPERGGSPRDLDFVDALLDLLAGNNQVDPANVFALGISNGGQFVFRLACERPSRFAGFATALSNLPVAASSWRSGPPIPIAMIFGGRDRVMPRAGGRLRRPPGLRDGGEVMSKQATVQFWLRHNGAKQPRCRNFVSAGRPIDIEDYPSGPDGAPVRCITVAHWGHRWPRWGRSSCPSVHNFSAADLVMEFFAGLSLSGKSAPVLSSAAERSANS